MRRTWTLVALLALAGATFAAGPAPAPPTAQLGDPCLVDGSGPNKCANGVTCQPKFNGASEGICGGPGAECSNGSKCASGTCVAGTSDGKSTSTCGTLDTGEYCQVDSQCDTGYCNQMTNECGTRPSPGARARARREIDFAGIRRRANLCPKGLTACQLGSRTMSYECVDTTTSLEHCGGCFNDATSPGVDCSDMDAFGASSVACADSRCVVTACARGFELSSGGECLSRFNM